MLVYQVLSPQSIPVYIEQCHIVETSGLFISEFSVNSNFVDRVEVQPVPSGP